MVWPPTPPTRTLWPRPATTRRSGSGTRPCMKWCPSPTWKVLCFGGGGFVGGGFLLVVLLLCCCGTRPQCYASVEVFPGHLFDVLVLLFSSLPSFSSFPPFFSFSSFSSFLSLLSFLFFPFSSFSSFLSFLSFSSFLSLLSLLSFLSLFVSKAPCRAVAWSPRGDLIGLGTGSGAVDKGDGEEEKSGAIVLLNAETLVRNLVGCSVSRGCCWDFVVEENIFLWSNFLNDFDLSVSEFLLRFHQPSSIDSFLFF